MRVDIGKLEHYIDWRTLQNRRRQKVVLLLKRLIEWLITLVLHIFTKHKVDTHCEVLFLPTSEFAQKRFDIMQVSLKEIGVSSASHQLVVNALKALQYNEPAKLDRRYWGSRFVWISAYINALVYRYRPKVVVTAMDASLFSPFLREYTNRIQGKVVNIAHGVSGSSPLFSMTEFDYYFVFAESSLENLLQVPVRYGTTLLHLTGNPYVYYDESIVTARQNGPVLILSSWIPESVKEDVEVSLQILASFASEHPEQHFIVKKHPLEKGLFWEKVSREHQNITLLNQSSSMAAALQQVSIVLHLWSNGSVEAGLYGCPSIAIDPTQKQDTYLHFSRFLHRPATSKEELAKYYEEIFLDYDAFTAKAMLFGQYHFGDVQNASEKCIDGIVELCRGNNLNGICLEKKLEGI